MRSENVWFQRDKRKFQKANLLLSPCITEHGGVWADFGCGEGIFTAILFQSLGPECEIHAIDKNQHALARLKRNFQGSFPEAHISICHADFTDPLPLPALDGFIVANALHFIPDDQKEQVLAAFCGLLKPGGKIIVVEYNARRGNYAVPFPLHEDEFFNLASRLQLHNPHIATNVPSSFMGEMYTGIAFASE
jgi:ubiquinone/menaquinone biosynthesis C-methylase UbiE